MTRKLKKWARAALILPVSSILWSVWAVAQQTTDPTGGGATSTTTTTTEVWYGHWWVWAVGVGVFLIVVIALTNRGGRSTT